MSSYWLYLLTAGLVVIIGLGFYAGRLLFQLKNQRIAIENAKQSALAGQKIHDEKVIRSILIIVKAMQEQQCDYSEGCWRLSVLLDSLKTSSELDQQFPAIFELYNTIKHMQILDARKALKKRERMQQDLERMKAEASLYEAVTADLALLAQYGQERLSVLKQA